jgi:hypothetical protein
MIGFLKSLVLAVADLAAKAFHSGGASSAEQKSQNWPESDRQIARVSIFLSFNGQTDSLNSPDLPGEDGRS